MTYALYGLINYIGRKKGKGKEIEVCKNAECCNSSSTMRFIHINEYEYMNNYAQYIILHTRIRIQ